MAGLFEYTPCKGLAKAIWLVNMYKVSVVCTLYALCKLWEGWRSSFLSGERRVTSVRALPRQGEDMHIRCWEIPKLLPGKSKSTLSLYRSIQYCRSRMHPCLSFHFFLHIYTQRCCVMLVLFGEWRFFSHHPAYGCFSRVPVCVCVCGKVRLLMIVDTRDTVPYHSSCTMGCSWSRPTMKTSIRSRTGMRPLEPVWKVAFGLVASVHFCRLIVIVWARVHAWRICSQRKTGLALGWRLNLQETACLTPKVLPQVSVNADYVIGYINTWFLCTKRSSFGCIWVH